MRKSVILVVMLAMLLSFTTITLAKESPLTGSQSVTVELHDSEYVVVLTNKLQLQPVKWFRLLALTDIHANGVDVDLNASLLPFGDAFVGTVGAKRSLYVDDVKWVPYVRVTVEF